MKKIAVCMHGDFRTLPWTASWIKEQYKDYDVDYFCIVNKGAHADVVSDFNPIRVRHRTHPDRLDISYATFNIIYALQLQCEYALSTKTNYEKIVSQRYDCISGPHPSNWLKCVRVEEQMNSMGVYVTPSTLWNEGNYPYYADNSLVFDQVGAVGFVAAGLSLLGNNRNHFLHPHGAMGWIVNKAKLHIIDTSLIYETIIIRDHHTKYIGSGTEIRSNWNVIRETKFDFKLSQRRERIQEELNMHVPKSSE